MDLSQIIPQLGSTGIAVLVLYMVAKEFIRKAELKDKLFTQSLKEKSERHAEMMEKKDTAFRVELKEREDAFRKLEREIRDLLLKEIHRRDGRREL